MGIRTACHAFDTRGKAPAGHAEWKSFDPDVLGGHYTGHHGNEAHPEITLAPGNKSHVIIRDIDTPFVSQGSLYKVSPLAAGYAAAADRERYPGQPPEPVAWINTRNACAGFLHIAGPPARFRERLVPQDAPQRGVLGTRPAAAAKAGAKPTRTERPCDGDGVTFPF